MSAASPAEWEPRQIDVAGLLSVRLVGGTPADVRAVERQLGLRATARVSRSDKGASISLRYVDRLPAREGILLRVGPSDLYWTEHGVAVVGGGRERWASIPFERVGDEMIIECERGIGRVPHLLAVLNLSLLARGVLALHASAFTLDGKGCAAAGWSQSGKTEALLAAMAAPGAQMVSDEWTYVTADGQARGLPTPIRLEPWHLRSPFVREKAEAALGRRRILGLRAADRLGDVVAARAARLPAARLVRRATRRAMPTDHLDVPPRVLFGAAACLPSVRLERVFWLASRADERASGDGLRVEAADAAETAARMALAHVHHRSAFLDAYWRFRYAFPGRRSELVEDMEERERALLEPLFRGVPVVRLEHPPHLDFGRLLEAMQAASA